MDAYPDTSFLCSYYLPDVNTPRARAFLLVFDEPLPFTALHRVELRNAFSLAIFRKVIGRADAAKTWAEVEADLQAGRLLEQSLHWSDVFKKAELFAEEESPALGTRSLDLLQMAAAKLSGAVDFLTFDTRQSALARLLGMTVRP